MNNETKNTAYVIDLRQSGAGGALHHVLPIFIRHCDEKEIGVLRLVCVAWDSVITGTHKYWYERYCQSYGTLEGTDVDAIASQRVIRWYDVFLVARVGGVAEENDFKLQLAGRKWGKSRCRRAPALLDTVVVSAAVEDSLQSQWDIVYTQAGAEEQHRERGGLVLADGSLDAGHFCFDAEAPLSARSKLNADVRVGSAACVHAGWDSTRVIAFDPSTYVHAADVFAHYHIHADYGNVRAERGLLPLEPQDDGIDEGKRVCADDADDDNDSVDDELQQKRYFSVPSLGDIAAWLTYHGNRPLAFVVTSAAQWLLWKWPVAGQKKQGIQCCEAEIQQLIEICTQRQYEPVTALKHELSALLLPRGFAIYYRERNARVNGQNSSYSLWL